MVSNRPSISLFCSHFCSHPLVILTTSIMSLLFCEGECPMSTIITKICQIDPRVVRFAMFILVGILTPIIVNAPGVPGGISG